MPDLGALPRAAPLAPALTPVLSVDRFEIRKFAQLAMYYLAANPEPGGFRQPVCSQGWRSGTTSSSALAGKDQACAVSTGL